MTDSATARKLTRPGASFVRCYGLAFASVAGALLLEVLFHHFNVPHPFAAFALCAIAITFWYGGTKPGIVAVLLSSVIRGFIFEGETSSLSRVFYELVFLAFAILMIWVRRSRDALEVAVADKTTRLTAANEELRREKEQLDELFELSPDVVILADDDFHVLRVNKEFTRIFGYTAEEVAGQWLPELIMPEEFRAEALKNRDRLISGNRVELEAIGQRKDGVRFGVSVVAKGISLGLDQVAMYLIYRDITDRKKIERKLKEAFEEIKQRTEAARRSERELRDVVNTVPAYVWSTSPEGQVDFVSDRWLQFTGLAVEEAFGWKWEAVVHPDDRTRLVADWHTALKKGRAMESEARVRRADGQYCWWFTRNVPLRDETGKVVRWYGTAIDIEDRKRAEQVLQKSEERWRSVFENSAIGVALTDLNGRFLATNHTYQTMVGYTEQELRALCFLDVTHRDYREANWALITELLEGKQQQFQIEKKYLRKDGSSIWVSNNVSLVPGTERVPQFIMALSEDITQRKRAEEALQRSEGYLAEAQKLTHTGSWAAQVSHLEDISWSNIYWSEEMHRIFDFDPDPTPPSDVEIVRRLHPEDERFYRPVIQQAIREKTGFEADYRLLLPNGAPKYIHVVGHPTVNASGDVIEIVGTAMDVTEQHEARAALEIAFEQIKAEETELRRMTDAIATPIYVLRRDGTPLFANQTVLDYTGLALEDLQREDHRARVLHPEDEERLREQRREALARGKPFEVEQRWLWKDGNYRWFLVRYNPLRDEQGNIIRWYATGTDIEDRKHAEERMRSENLALREQIDQAFMFEEIVGASPALQSVLSSIVKVAPTDSTVLIAGETGTGKELIARAIHKHSQRSAQAFISVNCASIPSSLIASELFGHEKGAFTGAVQRRQGRFELAHSGSIFLDEVGELPPETQIALLRVLQERQFERVGGSRTLATDVRVIAATNRDLTAAIAAGMFRADLFYRLNVFPIEVPALRKRKEDIPMLVEYFVKRYAEKSGKHIRKIDKVTLELCQLYPWPGNIRELQNIVERSVISCSGDTFWIEKAWLTAPEPVRQELLGALPNTLQNHEREIIETALAECKGKIAGPKGAAAKLGIPRSTLDSKIKQLRIKKHKFISEP
jgi:PAS domain S-box-containing protein